MTKRKNVPTLLALTLLGGLAVSNLAGQTTNTPPSQLPPPQSGAATPNPVLPKTTPPGTVEPFQPGRANPYYPQGFTNRLFVYTNRPANYTNRPAAYTNRPFWLTNRPAWLSNPTPVPASRPFANTNRAPRFTDRYPVFIN